MGKPRLLDLFCGAGGAGRGYELAGFAVFGVDHLPQKRYPYPLAVADALAYLEKYGRAFDAVHASPPCQGYSVARHMRGAGREATPDLVGLTRSALLACGKPWILENVEGAPLAPPAVRLCGLMFGLPLFRHRWFESSALLLTPDHPSHRGKRVGEGGVVCVAGHGARATGYGARRRVVPLDHRSVAAWRGAMGIDWMTRDELAQALPPAYTRALGAQLLRALG